MRIACCNQLYTGAKSLAEFRELHLPSQEDLLAQMERVIYEALDWFDGALDIIKDAMEHPYAHPGVRACPRERGEAPPSRHVMAMAEDLPEYFGSALWGEAPKWDHYQLATSVISHKLSVNPETERMLERTAVRALLLEAPLDGTREVATI